MVKKITNNERATLVSIGYMEIAADSPIRGYRRTLNRKLLNAHATSVLKINEFRTTNHVKMLPKRSDFVESRLESSLQFKKKK